MKNCSTAIFKKDLKIALQIKPHLQNNGFIFL